MIKKIAKQILKFVKPVRVYDNYVKEYWHALRFINKIRWFMNAWVPIGEDAPFGRLCFVKGHMEDGTPLVKYQRLGAMEIHFTKNKKDCVWTHWSEYDSRKNQKYE